MKVGITKYFLVLIAITLLTGCEANALNNADGLGDLKNIIGDKADGIQKQIETKINEGKKVIEAKINEEKNKIIQEIANSIKNSTEVKLHKDPPTPTPKTPAPKPTKTTKSAPQS